MEYTAQAHREHMNQMVKELISLYRGAVSHSGISENEFWIWYTLIVMEGQHSQQSICSAWSISKQTVNTIISNMVKKGYVTLEALPGTRNRKRIQLTEAGCRYGEALIRPISQAELRAFQRLPVEEHLACMDILGKYTRILKEELYETQEQ